MKKIIINNEYYRVVSIRYRGLNVEALIKESDFKNQLNDKKIRQAFNKNSDRSYWEKKFWEVFSKFIRLRDNEICVCCGKSKAQGYVIQCGHWIPRTKLGTKYEESNSNCQCQNCNFNMEDQDVRDKYDKYMLEKYGQAHCDWLHSIKNSSPGFKTGDFKLLILEYQNKIKCLQNKNKE